MHSYPPRPQICAFRFPSWALWLPLTVGCGAAVSASTHLAGIERRSEGPDLATVTGEGEVARLGLWIDAGARDAKVPAIATIAARLAASHGGDDVHAWTGPDAIELSLPCPATELSTCVGKLARALSHRGAQPAAVAREQARLVRDRRTAIAGDPDRAADALALTALFGEEDARALLPLGDAAQDDEVDAASVAAFMAAHFGPKRALLIAAGPVGSEALREAATSAFARARAATARRAARSLHVHSGVEVQVDDATSVSIAISAPNAADALAHAHALRRTLLRTGAAREAVGHAMPMRGGALALLRVQPAGRLAAVVRESALYAAREGEPPSPSKTLDVAHDFTAATRRIGLRWAAEGAASVGRAVGVGVLRAGGRADRPKLDDADAPLRERMHERLEVVWIDAQDAADGDDASMAEEDEAHATLPNGAQLAFRRRVGNSLAVAVRFALGARQDPPTMHGRTALLATQLAHACRARVHATTGTPVTNVRPLVEADGWGLTLLAEPSAWRAATELALGCTLAPSWRDATLSTARIELLQQMSGEALAVRALAATLLGGGEPGALAPWGSREGVGRTSREALFALHAQSLRGGVHVGIVGALPEGAPLGDVLHRLAGLPTPRAAAEPSDRAGPADVALNLGEGIDARTVTLGWSAAGSASGASGATAFAASMHALIAYSPDVEVLWHDGGLADARAWAAIGVRASEARLAQLDAIVSEAVRQLDDKTLEHAVATSWKRALQQHADLHGGLAEDAWRLAGKAADPAAPELKAAMRTARALSAAHWEARLEP